MLPESIALLENIYQIEGLRHCYRERPVLSIDALSIRRSSIVGLIGPNGSGKSTLLNLLGFIQKSTRGVIRYKGEIAAPFSPVIRSRVTLLPQEPYLMKRSVFKNVAYGLDVRKDSKNTVGKVSAALSQVGLPPDRFLHRHWFELSGGEAQRVALAARLVLRPEVLLLDEPTRAVDADSAQLIKEASLAAREKWGTTLIVASHDWEWLDQICDQVIHLFRGRVMADGRRNILFGPWLRNSQGDFEKELKDGQCIRAAAPPDEEAVAVIDPSDFQVGTSPPLDGKPGTCELRGTISRMALDRENGRVILTVMVGNLALAASMEQERLEKLGLLPGKTAILSYHPNQIQWMAERSAGG